MICISGAQVGGFLNVNFMQVMQLAL